MEDKWTPKMVSARMEEAASTLRALHVTGLKPMGYRSSWPDVVHDPNEAYGWVDEKMRPWPPSPDAITRMEEALDWLQWWLDKDQSRLVWLHATGMHRKKICAVVGMSPGKVWRLWAAALMTIASAINASKKTLPPKESREEIFIQEYRRTGNASAAYRNAFGEDGLSQVTLKQRAARLARKIGDKSDRGTPHQVTVVT